MAFVLSTSKPPTACLGLACGRFADAHTPYLAVNRGNCISFYRVETGAARHAGGEGVSSGGGHETEEQDEEKDGGVDTGDVALGDLVHVQDYKLCCTLKYIHAVPLLHPDTGALLRHVLFLFSVKQEVSLVVLSWASQPRRAGKRGRAEAAASTRCKLVTLYHSGVEECLYQLRPSDVDLVCSSTTHAFMRAGGGRLMPGLRTTPPFVAFAVGRGEVYFLDVLAALGAPQRGSRRAKHRLDSVLPASLVALAEERGKLPCLSVSAFHSTEFEVRDVAFGPCYGYNAAGANDAAAAATTTASTMTEGGAMESSVATTSTTPQIPFYVLFADHHGRVHVSRYLFRSGALTPMTMTTTEPPVTSSGRGEVGVVPPLPFLRGTTLAAVDERLCRRDLLQSNVDTTASRLLVSPRGVYVVGTQLVTCIQAQRERKKVVTRPMPLGGPTRELACACLDDRGGLLVCASTGAVARLRGCRGEESGSSNTKILSSLTPMRHDAVGAANEEEQSRTMSRAELGEERGARVGEWGPVPEKEDLACVTTTQLPTVPTCVVAVTATMSVVGSQFANTLLLHSTPNGSHRHRTLIEHCGPIMDMTVVRDGPRTSVVASTGVDGGGGISLVRAAVKVTEQVVIPLLAEARSVLYTHGLLVLLFYGFSRFFALTAQGSSRLLAELTLVKEEEEVIGRDDEPTRLSNLLALHYDKQSQRYLALHETGASWLRVDADQGTVRRGGEIAVQGEANAATVPTLPLLFAAASSALCLVSDGSYIVALRDFARLKHHWHVEGGVSALAIVSATQFVYGDWQNSALALCDVTYGTVTARLVLVSPARSVCVVHWGSAQVAESGSSRSCYRRRQCRHGGGSGCGATADDESGAVRLVVGTLDGHIAEVSLRSLCEGQLLQLLLLKNEPVELGVLRGGEGILGFGDVPLVVLQRPEGLQVTGLTMQGVIACAALDDDDDDDDKSVNEDVRDGQDGPYYAILCRQSATLVICTLGEVQKMDRTFVAMGHTVTHVSYVPAWGGFVLALREAETDEIVYLPYAALERAQQGMPRLPWPQTRLLEYERCVFVEPLVLGAAHTRPPRAARLCAASTAEEADSYVVLLGSGFTFPDDHQARSSRIMWFQLDTHAAGALRQLGGKDIAGALQCCCVVPHYRGRIALGISGYVVLYNWSAVDNTFVAEDRCRVGLAITKLIPIFGQSAQTAQLSIDLTPTTTTTTAGNNNDNDNAVADRDVGTRDENAEERDTAMLVALDARHSAMFVAVNQLQGSLSVQGREAQLRGVMDGVVLPPQHLAMCDEMMNFLFMANELRGAADTPGGTPRGVITPAAAAEPAAGAPHMAGAAPAATGETTPPHYRLVMQAQGHVGDLVTAMQLGSFAPSAVSSEYVPTPRALIAGITGPQLIYGTAHGGFGTLTPVGRPTFLFLRAMELALWEVLTPHGGYEPDYYREVLRLGQERGLNRSVSLEANVLSSGGGGGPAVMVQPQSSGSVSGIRPPRPSSAAQNFCDGDAIEAYLLLKESKRQRVRWTAATTTVNWFAALLVAPPSSPLGTKSAAVTTDVRQWGALLAQAPPTQLPLAPQRELIDQCNEFLATEALPRLPYEDAAVEAFILTFQRVH